MDDNDDYEPVCVPSFSLGRVVALEIGNTVKSSPDLVISEQIKYFLVI